MKPYTYLIIFLGAIIATGCAKDLNQQPISSLTTQNFYLQPADFTQGLNAVYNSLRTYPDRILNLSETRSDNFMRFRTAVFATGKVLTVSTKLLRVIHM
ncbi:RagB/SusD family nutrient uptake outer membrane protein [Niabella sp. W65]|nr:RagB/SusD family nutrient uptake outer membrane protein [Niabella sp. W65]MCH7363899.1 RagB/SusD family nutrient uptake outer membrane protein [Niabella sp. W65]